jgi:hypothetical protein
MSVTRLPRSQKGCPGNKRAGGMTPLPAWTRDRNGLAVDLDKMGISGRVVSKTGKTAGHGSFLVVERRYLPCVFVAGNRFAAKQP